MDEPVTPPLSCLRQNQQDDAVDYQFCRIVVLR